MSTPECSWSLCRWGFRCLWAGDFEALVKLHSWLPRMFCLSSLPLQSCCARVFVFLYCI